MPNEIKNGDNNDEMSIILPLKKHELGNFITSLLGQQQSLSRVNNRTFDIDHAWLINLHEMIDQRIRQQASAHLVDFAAAIYFENDAKRIITTIDAFKGYIETKKETTKGVTLVWSYLIQFPGKSHPEKQEISFFARVNPLENSTEVSRGFSSTLVNMAVDENEYSFIGYEVSHTERTWGDDIEALTSNQIEKVIRPENALSNIAYNCFRWGLAIGLFAFFLIYPIYQSTIGSENAVAALMAEYNAINNEPYSITLLSSKIDIIANMLEAHATNKSKSAFTILTAFIAPILLFLTLRFTRKSSHSFIILSPADNKRRDSLLKKESRSIPLMLGAYLCAIAAGIFGNYGYSALIKLFS